MADATPTRLMIDGVLHERTHMARPSIDQYNLNENGMENDDHDEDGLHPNSSNVANHNNLDLMDFGRTRRSRMSFVAPDAQEELLLLGAFRHHNENAIDEETNNNDLPPSHDEAATTTPLLQGSVEPITTSSSSLAKDYGALQQVFDNDGKASSIDNEDTFDDEEEAERRKTEIARRQRPSQPHPCLASCILNALCQGCTEIVHQMPAIMATVILTFIVSIPIGAAYFPVVWDSSSIANGGGSDGTSESVDSADVSEDLPGPFPLPGKESLGVRMALFATFAGQLTLTFASGFDNPVAYQLLENVPFYHALAHIVIQEQGYGMDTLATLFFLFGLSSILVGILFYCLGRLKLGRVAYFFPAHVLVGCIGGIGVFVITASIEVTNSQAFSFSMDGLRGFVDHLHLYSLVILFEVTLRILTAVLVDKDGNQKYRFLTPIYFCSIVPIFYAGLFLMGFTEEQARDWQYLFPDPSCSGDNAVDCGSLSLHEKVFNGHILDIFRIIDFRLINWTAVRKSFGTLVALCSFSMIHVPINIPAFAVSSNVDVDMNDELIAHGYSNMLSGLFGGLQNVMTYSFSVLFQKSGGSGVSSCLAVAAGIAGLFVYGPAIAVYFPRCMAGTLLLHIGLDLFLEGSYDSYGNFDTLEYAGIWFVMIVMTIYGMTAGLFAGVLAALSTHAAQSIKNINPIFRILHATTLRSSSWERPSGAMDILDSATAGRARILIFQLQGHLFFGNVAELTDVVKDTLSSKGGTDEHPFIVILDFSLVLGMDSSAAHSIAKLKNLLHKNFLVEVCICVTGSHRAGFPCDITLYKAFAQSESKQKQQQNAPSKTSGARDQRQRASVDYNDVVVVIAPGTSRVRRGSVTLLANSKSIEAVQAVQTYRMCSCLDEALIFAEDILVARDNPSLLLTATRRLSREPFPEVEEVRPQNETEERALAVSIMESIVPMEVNPDVKRSIEVFVSHCVRAEYRRGDVLWHEGEDSDSAKILLLGTLCATIAGTSVLEHVTAGIIVGELGVVDGTRRFSTVTCTSPTALTYSLSRSVFETMVLNNQWEARLLERIAIRYLTHRVQHVSNRVFDTHCLPI